MSARPKLDSLHVSLLVTPAVCVEAFGARTEAERAQGATIFCPVGEETLWMMTKCCSSKNTMTDSHRSGRYFCRARDTS